MRPATAPNKVLEILGKQPGLNKYGIAKESQLSYSRVHESVQLLEKEGMIKGTIVGKTRVGLDKKNYSLTVLGFTILAGSYAKRRPDPILMGGKFLDSVMEKKGLVSRDSALLFEKKLDDLMKNYKAFFPLIAGKWDFFRKKGINQRILEMLGLTDTSDTKGYTKAVFIDFFVDISKEPKTLLKVVKVFSEDPDLRHVAYENMKILHAQHRSLSRLTEKILRILERQDPAPQLRGEKEKVKGR